MKHDNMKHIRRFWAGIISSFVFDKKTKDHVYQYISEFSFFDIPTVKKFQESPTDKKTVLLIETNGCHGEVISAYFQYFKDLGYNVDIVMHDFIYKEKHFTRHDISKINIYHCHQTAMHKMFKSKKMKEYKAIFIMTPINTASCQSVFTIFPELNNLNNVYVVAHNVPDIERTYKNFAKGHILGLGRKLNDFPTTNPHLFGKVLKNQTKHTPTTFITVGRIDPQIKDHKTLISAVKELVAKGYDFKVIIVGGGKKIPEIPENIKKYIVMPGRQIAEKMYRYMEQADFFLTLWDKNNPTHDKYRTNLISGSPQLIFGFNKIPIIQKEFADFYDFDNANAIVYQDDNLASAMERAILMKNPEYKKMYSKLEDLTKEVYNESLTNLKNILEK